MIYVLELKYRGAKADPNIGRVSVELAEAPMYETLRGGYYIAAPVRTDLLPGDPLQMSCSQLSKIEGVDMAGLPMVNWFSVFARKAAPKDQITGNKGFEAESRNRLQNFNTIKFLTTIPTQANEIIQVINQPDMYAVTDRADYKSLVKLAVARAKASWNTVFVKELIKKVARGTEDGDFCGWNECRAVTYELCPQLKGTLRAWKDWEAQDFGTLLSPADFAQKDDILVSTVLREKLISLEALRKCLCVPGLYDPSHHFLHWNLSQPEAEKSPLSGWAVRLRGKSVWDLSLNGRQASMSPEQGMVYADLISKLEQAQLPPLNHLPYVMSWQELDEAVEWVAPGEVETGLTLSPVGAVPPTFVFERVEAIEQIPQVTMELCLAEYGCETGGNLTTVVENFCKLLDSLYPAFEEKVNAAIGTNQLIRVNPTSTANKPDLVETLVPDSRHPILIKYLVAFYICLHTRGKTILDPAYVSGLYTKQGIFGDLTRAGYPPVDSSFASGRKKDKRGQREAPKFLAFHAPFGAPTPFLADEFEPSAEGEQLQQVTVDQDDLQIENLDDLFDDIV